MIRKSIFTTILAMTIALTGCGVGNMMNQGGTSATGSGGGLGGVLGSVLGGVVNANTASGLLDMVIGHVKLDQRELVGTWVYSEPGCAFTSENLLAKAGGSVAATQVKQRLATVYNSVGIASNNTYFAFDQNGRFEAKVRGIPLSGTYTFEPNNSKINLKTTLFTIPAFVTRTTNGLSLTMESKKLLNVLQTVTALTGNSTLSTVGELSKNFDGVRMGFDVVRYQ
ncbi:MAG: DUF4923 family protein [Muribaculaceae bacterium]|nr:DUF4923 family protein [Muribaculaceae bacterium]